MAKVLLSLGSNINRSHNIRSCVKSLREHFGEIRCSPVYESEAVGFDGENFYNMVVAIHTGLPVSELSVCLRAIENAHGRDRSTPKFSARTLDIDILTYDALTGSVDGIELPRDEILKNAFVLQPLADLVPEERHPIQHKTYQHLWQSYDKTQQQLWQVDLKINA